eukprot:353299-Chlamydomonas_euryale.AAC.6
MPEDTPLREVQTQPNTSSAAVFVHRDTGGEEVLDGDAGGDYSPPTGHMQRWAVGPSWREHVFTLLLLRASGCTSNNTSVN